MPTNYGQTAERIRALLAAEPSTREVSMFGGLSFMVNDKMIVNVRHDGDLLVRVDPRRSPDLVADHGARFAEMGAGRPMGPGWLDVAVELTATDDQLRFWLEAAMEFNARIAGGPETGRR
jgi:TfoX/Sxy family transcriptional regulator of competence genes